ncbi:hypothetical protein [Methylobacter sp. YRD-M1]|nr:hypothetical protein [Methylobacter sp. YRD-M1]
MNDLSIQFDPIDFEGRSNQLKAAKQASPVVKQGGKFQGLP